MLHWSNSRNEWTQVCEVWSVVHKWKVYPPLPWNAIVFERSSGAHTLLSTTKSRSPLILRWIVQVRQLPCQGCLRRKNIIVDKWTRDNGSRYLMGDRPCADWANTEYCFACKFKLTRMRGWNCDLLVANNSKQHARENARRLKSTSELQALESVVQETYAETHNSRLKDDEMACLVHEMFWLCKAWE